MTLVPSTAASAVYHDALSTARGFRTLCFLVLLLCLLGQLALFFTAKFNQSLIPVQGAGPTTALPTGASVGTTTGTEVDDGRVERNTDVTGNVSTKQVRTEAAVPWLYAILYVTLWLGLVFSILLSLDLLFTTLVMLNGRTVGVAKVAKSFLYSLLLLMLFIPWQAILNNPSLKENGMFHVPGVLYTWSELSANAKNFVNADWLGWVRFVVWPVVALVLLLVVFGRSGTGIKEALGEDLEIDEVPMDRPIS